MSDSRLPQTRGFLKSLFRKAGVVALAGVIMAGALIAEDAEARRMGGGRSMGRQSTSAAQQNQATPPSQSMQSGQAANAQRAAPAAAPGAAAAQPARNRWMGPLAGLAAGLGIAALLSHFGLGGAFAGAMANMIMIALIVMAAVMVFRFIMNRRKNANTPAYSAAGAGSPFGGSARTGFNSQEPSYVPQSAPGGYGPSAAALSNANTIEAAPQVEVPAGFDSEAFVRNAKVYFVRLQDAWDRGNSNDIREFTTPEMFAEVKLDIDARGTQPNRTDVVQLNADILGVEERGTESLASVRFHGLIRESEGAAAEPFIEIWNLSKQKYGNEGWLLAGIQQVS
ncbi:Tim44-like domain protein [Caballeronia sp. SBC1]|uniref:Tim44 domain-containing protein n=1 Tax=unclassified Caballeronia TaxID=2646786 RepID=UPI0013E1569C|nr:MULTISPECIES: Tim44-like domain-containing protein [unclassified Caballeronia]QIE22366.1 Tim44-like domain protein [Caballeronia sp. SBC2]QIN60436.1 Tim44-like domain protein [Caballeronia sp. SBC1]